MHGPHVQYCGSPHQCIRREHISPSQQASGGMGCSASVQVPQHPAVSGSQPSGAPASRSALPQKPLEEWSEEVRGCTTAVLRRAASGHLLHVPFELATSAEQSQSCMCMHGILHTQEVESWMRSLHANLSQHAPTLLPASGKLIAAWDNQVWPGQHAQRTSAHASLYACGL